MLITEYYSLVFRSKIRDRWDDIKRNQSEDFKYLKLYRRYFGCTYWRNTWLNLWSISTLQ